MIKNQKSCDNQWDVNGKGALLEIARHSSIILDCAVKLEFEKAVKDCCFSNKIDFYKMEKDSI